MTEEHFAEEAAAAAGAGLPRDAVPADHEGALRRAAAGPILGLR